MITSAICIVNGIRSQKPRPHASTTSSSVDGVAATPATTTTIVASSANTNASGTHRSVQSVRARATRAIGPVASSATRTVSAVVLGSVRSDPLGMQRQLLHTPVVHVRHEQVILGRARDTVNPIELFHVMSRLAERTENLSVERQLVNAPGFIVGRVEILGRRIGDADRPGLGFIRPG